MAQRTKPLILMMATSIQARQLREQLRDAGFRVMEVPPDDVVSSYLDFMPGLVLLEYGSDQAPVEDAAQRIRDTDAGSAVPIYLFGGGAEPNPIEVVTMGADLYIHLPVKPQWLADKLSYLGGIEQTNQRKHVGTKKRSVDDKGAKNSSHVSHHAPKQDRPVQPEDKADDGFQKNDSDDFDPDSFDPNDFGRADINESKSFLIREQDLSAIHESQSSPGWNKQDDNQNDDQIFGSLDNAVDVPAEVPEIDLHALDVEATLPGVPLDELVHVDEPLDAALNSLGSAEHSDAKDWLNSNPGMDPALQEQIETSQASIPRMPVSEEEIEASRSHRDDGSPSQHWSTHSVTGPSHVSVHRVTFVSAHGQRDTTEVISEDRVSGSQDTVVGLKWKTQQNDIEQLEEDLDDQGQNGEEAAKARQPADMDRQVIENLPPGQLAPNERSDERHNKQDSAAAQPAISIEVTADERPKEEQQKEKQTTDRQSDVLELPLPGTDVPALPVDLAEHPALGVVMALASARSSQGLSLTRNTARVDLFFDNGRLVGGHSPDEDRSLATRLVRMSRLTSSHVKTVESLSQQRGITFEQALLQGGFLDQATLTIETSRYVRSLFYEVCGWREGQADWLPDSANAVRLSGSVDWAELVLEGLRRSWTDTEALDAIEKRPTRPTWRSPDFASLFVTRMDLTPSEIRAVRLFSQGFECIEAAHRSDLPPADLARILKSALFLGLLADPDENRKGSTKPMSQAVDSAPGEVPDEIHRERILAKLEQVREADYLALLGLPPGASPYVVTKAHEDLQRTFSDEALPSAVAKEMADELALIRQVLREAMNVLTHEKYAELYQAAIERQPLT